MENIVDMIIDDIFQEQTKDGKMLGAQRASFSGTLPAGAKLGWVATPSARKKITDMVGLAEKRARAFAKYKAVSIAAVATELMMTGVNEGALQILAGQAVLSSSMETGLFAMEEDKGLEFSIANADAHLQTKQIKFNPADSGRYGKFFESFFYGLESKNKSESPLPDLQQLGKKYSEIIEYLSPELKATGGSEIKVGTKSVLASFMTPTGMPPKSVETITMGPPKRVFGPGVPKKWATVGMPVRGDDIKIIKFIYTLKAEVDTVIKIAVGVVKLLQKMAALMVINTTTTTTTGSISGSAKEYTLFKYVSATIFAQINVNEIMKALDLTSTNKFFSVDIETVQTPPITKEEYGAGNYGVDTATITVKINGLPTSSASGVGGANNLYGSKYSLWDDDKSRDAFFLNMYAVHRKNSLFAVAPRGSPQAAFNKEIGAAIRSMRIMQGH